MKTRILIIGGGYGGLGVARGLSRHTGATDRYDVTIADPGKLHTVKTRLHEAACSRTGRVPLLTFPLRRITRMYGANFIQSAISAVDLGARTATAGDVLLEWDILVMAAGAETNFFGIPGAAEHAESLWSLEAAQNCSRRLQQLCAGRRSARIALCGAGLVGVEMASQLRESYPSRKVEIVVLEKADTIMAASSCGSRQRDYVMKYFDRHRIELRLGCGVAEVTEQGAHLDGGALECGALIWCSGIKRVTAGLTGAGGWPVGSHLEHDSRGGVFGLGDFVRVDSRRKYANALTAQRALYQAEVCADNIARYIAGRPLRVARYVPKGELVSLGSADGVGVVAGQPVTGPAVAAFKKANEARYLAMLFGNSSNPAEYFTT